MAKIPAFYVSFNTKFAYVRGRPAACAKLAEWLGTTPADVAKNYRRLGGFVKRITEREARTVGV